MNKPRSYPYVGAKEIAERVDEKYEGKKIARIEEIQEWITASDQTILHEHLIATFIINEQQELVISDRHSEHVMCAGGNNVLSAGEITFNFETAKVYVSEISNQSTGYCPEISSWSVVERALDKIGIAHPGQFTRAFEFRYCEQCQSKNLIKEEVYECAVCGSALDLEWNIDKIER